MGKARQVFVIFVISLFFLILGVGWSAEKKPLLQGKTGKEEKRKNSDQPLRVTSQELEADNKKLVIIFKGTVVAKQGDLTIYADMAHVYYEKKEEGNEVREIVATGNVKILEGDRVATGQKAVFTNADQKIVLTGQPKAWQGKDMVSGERIIVFLEEDKSFVESGPDRRVEVILYPKREDRPGKRKP